MNKLIIPFVLIVALSVKAQEITKTGSVLTYEEATTFLQHHNFARAEVGVPALDWDEKLAKSAQHYANYLASKNCALTHAKSGNFGENLYWSTKSDFNIVDASVVFYEEKLDYKYSKFKNGFKNRKMIGHYTQMIWSTTNKVGVGVAICRDGGHIVVARYYPTGNYIGQFPY